METLDVYTKIAEKLISRYGQPWMLDDEYVGIIINNLIKSDIRYNNKKGASLRTYRYGGFLFSVKLLYKLRKERMESVSLDNPDYNGESRYEGIASTEKEPSENLMDLEDFSKESQFISNLITTKELTPREQEYLNLIYINGMTHNEIAEKFNVSRQAVSYLEQKALAKLRDIYA